MRLQGHLEAASAWEHPLIAKSLRPRRWQLSFIDIVSVNAPAQLEISDTCHKSLRKIEDLLSSLKEKAGNAEEASNSMEGDIANAIMDGPKAVVSQIKEKLKAQEQASQTPEGETPTSKTLLDTIQQVNLTSASVSKQVLADFFGHEGVNSPDAGSIADRTAKVVHDGGVLFKGPELVAVGTGIRQLLRTAKASCADFASLLLRKVAPRSFVLPDFTQCADKQQDTFCCSQSCAQVAPEDQPHCMKSCASAASASSKDAKAAAAAADNEAEHMTDEDAKQLLQSYGNCISSLGTVAAKEGCTLGKIEGGWLSTGTKDSQHVCEAFEQPSMAGFV